MLTVCFSALLVCLAAFVGVGIPMISVHLEMRNQRELEHAAELRRQRELLIDREATIDAYRQRDLSTASR